MWAMACTACSKASSVRAEVLCTPLTLRTYWRAAASISVSVAEGSSPRRVVMLRHMSATLGPPGPCLLTHMLRAEASVDRDCTPIRDGA